MLVYLVFLLHVVDRIILILCVCFSVSVTYNYKCFNKVLLLVVRKIRWRNN